MVDPSFEKLLCESLCSLENGLKDACKELQADRRGGAITALQSVIAFVESIPRLESQNLLSPLVDLLSALNDLENGRAVAMLEPTGVQNRKPDPGLRKAIRAHAIFAIDTLISRGMSQEEACKFVAAELKAANIPVGGRSATPPWRTINSWRKDNSRRDAEDQQQDTLEELRRLCIFPELGDVGQGQGRNSDHVAKFAAKTSTRIGITPLSYPKSVRANVSLSAGLRRLKENQHE